MLDRETAARSASSRPAPSTPASLKPRHLPSVVQGEPMQHRHLLPNEIDLLLDGEVGFGVAPLRAHVDGCEDCQARLARSRKVVDAPRGPAALRADAALRRPGHGARADRRTLARRRARHGAATRAALGADAHRDDGHRVGGGARAHVRRVSGSRSTPTSPLYSFNLAADARTRRTDGRRRRGHRSRVRSEAVSTRCVRAACADVALGAGVMALAVGGAALGLRALASSSRRGRE